MHKVIHRSADRGKSELGWLSSRFSFSFADYSNSKRNGFGKLLVVNDDTIAPGKGFGAHSHDNMEIITLVTKGELEHKDSLGNQKNLETGFLDVRSVPRSSEGGFQTLRHIEVLRVGEMQVMSAGRGITHSEYNHSKTKSLELFQLWIETARPEITPRHETKVINLRDNELTLVVSGQKKDNLLFINQDATISLGKFTEEKEITYSLGKSRGLFIFVIEGDVVIDGMALSRRDSIEITEGNKIDILVKSGLYLMVVDVGI